MDRGRPEHDLRSWCVYFSRRPTNQEREHPITPGTVVLIYSTLEVVYHGSCHPRDRDRFPTVDTPHPLSRPRRRSVVPEFRTEVVNEQPPGTTNAPTLETRSKRRKQMISTLWLKYPKHSSRFSRVVHPPYTVRKIR